MVTVDGVIASVPARYWFAIGVLLFGIALGLFTGVIVRRLLIRVGVPETIEGTSFERMARDLGTSTVNILSKLATYFIYGVAALAAFAVARIDFASRFWDQVANFLPQFFVALFILIVGIVVGDKVELYVAERLRGVKVPQIGIIPLIAKWSVIYIATLVALSQVGVATLALVVLLAAYLFAVIFFGGLAFRSLLASVAAGVYLLLYEPYGIGDEVVLGERSGIVQEVDLFITHVEAGDEEFIVPNRIVFEEGIVRVR